MTDDIEFFRRKIASATDTDNRIHLLNKAASALYASAPEQAFAWAEEALGLARELGDRRCTADSLFNLGITSGALARYRDALSYYGQALDRYEEPDETLQKANTIANMGLICSKLAEYGTALEHYQQGLLLAEELESPILISRILNSIGGTYQRLGDWQKALDYCTRSLAVRETQGDGASLGPVLNNIANIHLQLGNDDVALDYYHRNLRLCTDADNDYGRGLTLVNIAEVYMHRREYEQALDHQLEALSIFTAAGNLEMQALTLSNIGKVYEDRGELDTAIEYQMQAQDIARSIEKRHTYSYALCRIGNIYRLSGQYDDAITSLSEALEIAVAIQARLLQSHIHDYLAQAYEALGQPQKALEHLRRVMRIREEDISMEQRQIVEEVNTRYEVEKMQREKELYRLKYVELAEALREVEALNIHLQELSNEKSELLSIVTHELRNPLTGILASVTMMKNYLDRMSEEEVHTQLYKIEATIRRSSATIDHLLDINAIESGRLSLSPYPLVLADITGAVVAQYAERAALKNLRLCYEPPAQDTTIMADDKALYEVVDNLLSNAVKYSPPGVVVHVQVERDGEVVRLRVRDEGPGLTDEDKNKLFGKFQRLSAQPTGGESSTGLGLYITRQIVELHGGTIRAESTAGHGSTFIVEFPACRAVVAVNH